jgi:hypothetical protein
MVLHQILNEFPHLNLKFVLRIFKSSNADNNSIKSKSTLKIKNIFFLVIL